MIDSEQQIIDALQNCNKFEKSWLHHNQHIGSRKWCFVK